MIRLVLIIFLTLAFGVMITNVVHNPDPIGIVLSVVVAVMVTVFTTTLVHDHNLGDW